MFKKVALMLSVSISIVVGVTQSHAANMTFGGLIVADGCKIANADSNLKITMGDVDATDRATLGEKLGDAVPFQVHLVNCALEDKPNVYITFNGAASSNADLFALDGDAGAATGLGVAFSLTDGAKVIQKMPPGHTVTLNHLKGTTAKPADNTLNFSAQYIATATDVTVGDAQVTAEFNLHYD